MKSMIAIEDLPLRAKRLSENELGNVFGGCKKNGTSGCSNNKECCSGKCYGDLGTVKADYQQLGVVPAPFKANEFGKTVCK